MNVFLVELETGARIRDWVDQGITCDTTVFTCDDETIDCAAKAFTYYRTLDDDMLYVTKLLQDGAPLEQVDPIDFYVTPGAWYLSDDRILFLHSEDDATPATSVFVVVVVETLARGATIIKPIGSLLSILPLVWDGRVTGLPSITQAITPDELGNSSIATLGELTIDNTDGRYDRLANDRILSGMEIRIHHGDSEDAFSDFDLWLKALMQEPAADADRLSIPLLSLAARLDQPAITDTFTTAAYPSMDANITGFNMPKVWGTVFGAEAFRIASGRWKWANHAVTSISAVKKTDGTAVATTGTDHALGEFTVDASYDTESRLYVDGRGYALDYPGELIADVVQKLGSTLTTEDMDAAALAVVDDARPVKVGVQVRTGSVREVLDLIAHSAFIDYFVDRENILSARVRQRDQGNYVENDDFEVDTTGWAASTGATISRSTSYRFRGDASLQIVKAAGSPLAYARASSLNLIVDKFYVVTMLAAVVAGATAAFRLSLTDSVGHEFFSQDYTLSSTEWTRITFTTAVPLDNNVVLCDSLDVTCDSTDFACDTEGGDLRVYPQYNGGSAVTVVIDDVEVVEAIVLDDANTEIVAMTPTDPTLWRVRAGFEWDGRLQTRRFASSEDDTTHQLYATAESREIPGFLVEAAGAAIVADAALDYYQAGRTRVDLRFLDPETLVSVGGSEVLFLDTTRRPTIPGDGQLFRLVSVNEERPEDGTPELKLMAEALYDPIFDQMTITAA